jgi:hypothetical protein
MLEHDAGITRRELPMERTIPVDELIAMHPERLRREGSTLYIKSLEKNEEYPVHIPEADQLAHKGGGPRLLAKIAASGERGSQPGTLEYALIEVELPFNDVDVVAHPDNIDALKEAAAMDVEEEGIELDDRFNMGNLAARRDVTMNAAFLAKDGLHMATCAKESGATGHIAALCSDERLLYGLDFIVHDDQVMLKNRGMFRLMKFVAEGKAVSFDMLPRNQEIDTGIYLLVLARKFEGSTKMVDGEPTFVAKAHSPLLMERLFEIAKKISPSPEDQASSPNPKLSWVRPTDKSIYDVLDRIHEKCPYFDLEAPGFANEDTARWLSGKLSKQAERFFRTSTGVKSLNDIRVREGDTETYVVKLDKEPTAQDRQNVTDEQRERHAVQRSAFEERCRARTGHFKAVMDSGGIAAHEFLDQLHVEEMSIE